jgi:hypothetical protein
VRKDRVCLKKKKPNPQKEVQQDAGVEIKNSKTAKIVQAAPKIKPTKPAKARPSVQSMKAAKTSKAPKSLKTSKKTSKK